MSEPGRGEVDWDEIAATAKIWQKRTETAARLDGPPRWTTWAEYRDAVAPWQVLERCRQSAKRANRKRLLSGRPREQVTALDVLAVFEAAEGRCAHCGSLAVEGRPSGAAGAPALWGQVGRRVGSLEHVVPRFAGGTNERSNLAWSCLWCNTWPDQRAPGATDHGAVQPG